MTLAASLRPLVRSIRGIPGSLGLRPHRVYLVQSTWGGEYVGSGNPTDVVTEIVEGGNHPPKVRQVDEERMVLSNLAQGSLEIGPITTTSVSAEALRGLSLLDKESLRVRVDGPTGSAFYRIEKLGLDRALHWMLTVSPISNVPVE
ncbi:MAG TPA: hypothetical protein VGK73_08640 [Polyangiaceae bacterium]